MRYLSDDGTVFKFDFTKIQVRRHNDFCFIGAYGFKCDWYKYSDYMLIIEHIKKLFELPYRGFHIAVLDLKYDHIIDDNDINNSDIERITKRTYLIAPKFSDPIFVSESKEMDQVYKLEISKWFAFKNIIRTSANTPKRLVIDNYKVYSHRESICKKSVQLRGTAVKFFEDYSVGDMTLELLKGKEIYPLLIKIEKIILSINPEYIWLKNIIKENLYSRSMTLLY